MFKAALFDLDGTLLDTLDDIADSMNDTLRRMGWAEHAVDAYRWFVGDGVEQLVRRALPEERRTEKDVAHCLKLYREEYGRRWNARTRPYDGVPEMLRALEAAGLRLAVLSNKSHNFTLQCVEEFLPGNQFDLVLGHREGHAHKPDPASALEVARTLGIAPADFLYLGDTAVDMQTALSAGMYPVGALWGFRPESELRQAGAKALIKEPMEMVELIG